MPVPVVPIFDARDYEAQVRRGGKLLRDGGLVVLPTETLYGVAGRVDCSAGRGRLRAFRGDEANGRPFTIHLARGEDAEHYLGPVNDFARRLMHKLWPGPVGLWFDVPADRRAEVARSLKIDQSDIYDEGGIVLRYPDNAFATDVLAAAGGPVALTAVGGKTPLDIAELADRLDGKVDLIFDGGPSRYNKPSTLLKVLPNRYEIVRQGVYDERIIEKMLKTTILFVCSGNTCRSAMAEALARASLVKQLGGGAMELEKRGISIISAGSSAVAGSPAAAPAVEAVKPMGGDLSAHRSKPLSVELIHQADAIFTMSRAHAAAVLSLVPAAADKTTTLDPAGDIEDPIGGSLALYVDLAAYLRQLINKRLAELKIT